MDWETLLALTGLYIMFIGTFAHFLKAYKKLIDLDKKILQMSTTNQKILEEVKNLVANTHKKGEG